MVTQRPINLIETKTETNPELDKLTAILKRASYITVSALVISGILVGGIYSYLGIRQSQLKDKQQSLLTSITQDTAKEGYLVAIKERISVLDKILADQKHMSALFTLVSGIVPAGSLTGLSLDDNSNVTITANISSVSEAIEVVDAVLSLGEEKKLSKAALASFGLSSEKGLELSLSFVPVL